MIRFIPNVEPLWARKSQRLFESHDDMKAFVADKVTRIAHYIGSDRDFLPDDVEIRTMYDFHPTLCLKNCYKVILAGRTIGFCGE